MNHYDRKSERQSDHSQLAFNTKLQLVLVYIFYITVFTLKYRLTHQGIFTYEHAFVQKSRTKYLCITFELNIFLKDSLRKEVLFSSVSVRCGKNEYQIGGGG